MKRCYDCKQVKGYKDFHQDNRSSDGRMSLCKECRKTLKDRKLRDSIFNLSLIEKEDKLLELYGQRLSFNKLSFLFNISIQDIQYVLNLKKVLNKFKCIDCNGWKNSDDFDNAPTNKSGKKGKCKSCISKYMKQYTSTPERKEVKKQYDLEREKKPEIRERKRNRAKERYHTDIAFKLRSNISTYLWEALSRNKENKNISELLEFNIEELINELNLVNSNKDKYLNGELHLDHIRPVSSFNITGVNCEDFRKCWNLNNFQLLPADINLKKQDKWDGTEDNKKYNLKYITIEELKTNLMS